MKLDYETLLEKVVQARYTYAVSDNHEAILRAIQVRRGYERIAKESGIDMDDFNTSSCEKYLDWIFKE
jgi:predicted MPP superfamily phosphohydrolase